MRLQVFVFVSLAGAMLPIAPQPSVAHEMTALGLDSGKSIQWNLKVLSSPAQSSEEIWSGNIGQFVVHLSGQIVSPPSEIHVSTDSLHSHLDIQETFHLQSEGALKAFCPSDLLMDDGIGCDAVFYGCSPAISRCSFRVITYSRVETPEYSAIAGWVFLDWSSAGFESPTP
ncbi:hypothetical protein ABIB57_004654 [Devosia sp. UYZn731]|uniref:hypothetical protein n=1 Tax=Devosia sp. UYZn731 TaxID=3156345 RepID=UPI00339B35C1